MKNLFIIAMLLSSVMLKAQDLEGAWKLAHKNGERVVKEEHIKIFQDGYFSEGVKLIEGNEFLGTVGGEYTLDGNQYVEAYDFNTFNPSQVGRSQQLNLDFKQDKIIISNKQGEHLIEIWEKISDKKDVLTGNWVITGRKIEDKLSTMTPGARRTVKILSGGRFQWIAFNSETRELSGTGGGTYSADNGVYKENITFFSKDNSRAGATLDFKYEVKDGQWHHSGNSSTGSPIYEIWSPYKDAYQPD